MAVATYQDVAVALGRSLSDPEIAQVNYWLDGAEMMISARLGDVTVLDQSALAYVETEAVAARVSNPTPDPGGSEQIDDYVRRWGPSPFRGISILDEWWSLLAPNQGAGLSSVRPYFEPDLEPPPESWA